MSEAMEMVEGLIDGRLSPADRRSPFFSLPVFRTNFWRGAAAAGVAVAAGAAWYAGFRRGRGKVS